VKLLSQENEREVKLTRTLFIYNFKIDCLILF
jgi:hypothetical protein